MEAVVIVEMHHLFSSIIVMLSPHLKADCCIYFIHSTYFKNRTAHYLIVALSSTYLLSLLSPPFPPDSGGKHPALPPYGCTFVSLNVFLPKMSIKLTMTTPPPIAETFVRVMVGFGGDWAFAWRLDYIDYSVSDDG